MPAVYYVGSFKLTPGLHLPMIVVAAYARTGDLAIVQEWLCYFYWYAHSACFIYSIHEPAKWVPQITWHRSSVSNVTFNPAATTLSIVMNRPWPCRQLWRFLGRLQRLEPPWWCRKKRAPAKENSHYSRGHREKPVSISDGFFGQASPLCEWHP